MSTVFFILPSINAKSFDSVHVDSINYRSNDSALPPSSKASKRVSQVNYVEDSLASQKSVAKTCLGHHGEARKRGDDCRRCCADGLDGE